MSRDFLSVEATLKTRCGCSKLAEVPYPPAPTLYVPLKTKVRLNPNQDDLSTPTFTTRSFDLQDAFPAGDKFYAIYEERCE